MASPRLMSSTYNLACFRTTSPIALNGFVHRRRLPSNDSSISPPSVPFSRNGVGRIAQEFTLRLRQSTVVML